MSEAPPAGKFGYRWLADVAKREASLRRSCLPYDVGHRGMTMAAADDAIEAMQDIADILDWLADREIDIAGDDGYGGDN